MTIIVKQYRDGWAVGTENKAELCATRKQAYIAALQIAAKAEDVIRLTENDYFFCEDFAEEDKQERPDWTRFWGERYRFASEVIDHHFTIASDDQIREAVFNINCEIRRNK